MISSGSSRCYRPLDPVARAWLPIQELEVVEESRDRNQGQQAGLVLEGGRGGPPGGRQGLPGAATVLPVNYSQLAEYLAQGHYLAIELPGGITADDLNAVSPGLVPSLQSVAGPEDPVANPVEDWTEAPGSDPVVRLTSWIRHGTCLGEETRSDHGYTLNIAGSRPA